jgi:hypothetical protein
MLYVAGRVYKADNPVLDSRGELPLPLGRLASYLYRLAILIRPDDFLSVSRYCQRSQHGTPKFVTPNLYARATKPFNQLIVRNNIRKLLDNLLHFAEISPDEHAFMLFTAVSLTTYDTRLYVCRPYSGDPADFERFISNLEIRLSREHLPNARSATKWNLASTMNGKDNYGEVYHADPERFTGPVDDENANTADRRERKLMLADYTKHNSLIYYHVLSLITNPNLKKMIQSTPGVQLDGYKALECLRDHCFCEPNDLTVQQLDST